VRPSVHLASGMDKRARREAARERLARGQLPRINPIRIWVDDGTWHGCAVCLEQIIESMTEYELEFELPFGSHRTQRVSFWFHKLCFAAWLVERVRQ
jgi:hypothetical protein